MKRFFSLLLLLLLASSIALPVNAKFQNPSIVDEAGYLMQSELLELSEQLNKER